MSNIEAGQIVYKVSTDTSKLKAELSGISNELSKSGTSWDNYIATVNKLDSVKSVENTTNDLSTLNKSLADIGIVASGFNSQLNSIKTPQSMQELHGITMQFSTGLTNATKETTTLESNLNKLYGTTEKTNNAFKNTTSDTSTATSGIGNLKNKLSELMGTNKSTEESTQKLGSVFTSVFSANLVLEGLKLIIGALKEVGEHTVKLSLDFQSAFSDVTKTVDGTKEELDGLKEQLNQMVITSGSTDIFGLTELASVGGQFGLAIDELGNFVQTMSSLEVATDIVGETGATAFSKLASNMKVASDEYSNLGSSLVALGNNFKSTESKILTFSTRLSQTASQVGINITDTLAYATTLDSMGLSAESSGSALSRIWQDIQKAVAVGGEELENFANVSGVSAETFRKAFQEDANAGFMMFLDGLSQAKERGTETIVMLDDLGIASSEEVNTLLALSGNMDLLSSAMETANAGYSENIALSEEVATKNETANAQFNMTKNILDQISLAFTDGLAEGTTEFAKGLNEVLIGLLDIVKGAEDTETALIDFFDNLIQNGIQTLKNSGAMWVQQGAEMVFKIIDGIGSLIPSLLEFCFQMIVQAIQGIVRAFPKLVETGSNIIANLLIGILNLVPQFYEQTKVIISSVIKMFMDNAENFKSLGFNLIANIINGIIVLAVDLIIIFGELIGDIVRNFPAYMNTFKEFGRNLIKSIWNGIKELAGTIATNFSNLINDIVSGTDSAGGKMELGTNIIKTTKSQLSTSKKELAPILADISSDITSSFSPSTVETQAIADTYTDLGTQFGTNLADSEYKAIEKGGENKAKAQASGNDKLAKEQEKAEKERLKELEKANDEQEKEFLNYFNAIEDALKEKYKNELELLEESNKEYLNNLKETYQSELETVKETHSEKLELYEEEHQARLKALGIELEEFENVNNAEIQDIKNRQALRKEEERILKEEENIKKKEQDILKAREELAKLQSEQYSLEDEKDRLKAQENYERQLIRITELEKSLAEYKSGLKVAEVERGENARIKELEAESKLEKELNKKKIEEEKENYKIKIEMEKENFKNLNDEKEKLYNLDVANAKKIYADNKNLLDEQLKDEAIFNQSIKILQGERQQDIIGLIEEYNPKYIEAGKKQGVDYIMSQISGITERESQLYSKLDAIDRYVQSRIASMQSAMDSVVNIGGSLSSFAFSPSGSQSFNITQNNNINSDSPYMMKQELNGYSEKLAMLF